MLTSSFVSLVKRSSSSGLSSVLVPSQTRCISWKDLKSKLMPELSPELKEFKERESRVVKQNLLRGKMSDAMKASTEKTFIGGTELLPRTPGNLFPELIVQNIHNFTEIDVREYFRHNQVTFLTIAFQDMSQKQLIPWIETFQSTYEIIPASLETEKEHPIRALNILYLQGIFFKIFSKSMITATEKSLPKDVASVTHMVFEPRLQVQDHFCDRIGIVNRMMGHVYLIDSKGYIRWRASGVPQEDELKNLASVIYSLKLDPTNKLEST